MEVEARQVTAAFQPGSAQEGVELAQGGFVGHQQVHPEVSGALMLDLHVEEPVRLGGCLTPMMGVLDVFQLLGDVVAHLGGALLVTAEVAPCLAGASSDVGHVDIQTINFECSSR